MPRPDNPLPLSQQKPVAADVQRELNDTWSGAPRN